MPKSYNIMSFKAKLKFGQKSNGAVSVYKELFHVPVSSDEVIAMLNKVDDYGSHRLIIDELTGESVNIAGVGKLTPAQSAGACVIKVEIATNGAEYLIGGKYTQTNLGAPRFTLVSKPTVIKTLADIEEEDMKMYVEHNEFYLKADTTTHYVVLDDDGKPSLKAKTVVATANT